MSQKFMVSWKELSTVLRRALHAKTTPDVVDTIVEDFNDELLNLMRKKAKNRY